MSSKNAGDSDGDSGELAAELSTLYFLSQRVIFFFQHILQGDALLEQAVLGDLVPGLGYNDLVFCCDNAILQSYFLLVQAVLFLVV